MAELVNIFDIMYGSIEVRFIPQIE